MIKSSIFVSLPPQPASPAESTSHSSDNGKLQDSELVNSERHALKETGADDFTSKAVIFSCAAGLVTFTFSILYNYFPNSAFTVLLKGRDTESIVAKLLVFIVAGFCGGYLGYSSQNSKRVIKKSV